MNGNELDLLCSLNLRKWSDRYGDWSFADAAAIDECAIRSFMADRQLPPHTITLFLHEVTHHLLLDSPVGLVLGVLEAEAKVLASRFKNAREMSRQDALRFFEWVLRLEVASNILKPLNEGIALFAEHDIYDFNEESDLSAPLRNAWRMFANPRKVDRNTSATIDLVLNRYLHHCRTSPEGLERKVKLLGQPLRPVQDAAVQGGLAAYMFLKFAFIKAMVLQPAFIDLGADVFLSYVVWFFFLDRRFAGLILGPATDSIEDGEEYGREIARYFRRRLNEFVHSISDEMLRRCRQEMSGPSQPGDPKQAFSRELMRIASYSVKIRRNRNAMMMTLDDREYRIEHDEDNLPYQDGPGTLEIHISPWQRYGCRTVYSGGKLVMADYVYDDREEHAEERMLNRSRDRDLDKAEDERQSDHLAMILRGLPENRALERQKELLLDEIDEMYAAMALCVVEPQDQERPLHLMRDGGLLSVLMTQPDLVQRFVELSAYSSIFPGRRFLTAQFAQDGIDLKDVLAALDRCRKSSGFVFYVEGSDDSIRTLA